MTIAVGRTKAAPAGWARAAWPGLMLVTAAPFALFAVWSLASGAAALGDPWVDFLMYRDAAQRWLDGGPFYLPWQLGGPYEVWGRYGAVLYPPTFLVLLVPFTVLPAVLWWAIPVGLTAAVVAWHRPAPAAWPFLAMCLAWPNTTVVLAHGNPTMWIVAAVAAGTVWGWPSVAVLLKPSLFPFALIGARRRSWWVALAAVGLVSLAFLPLWADWLRAVTGATDAGLLYSAKEIPTLLLPVVAWLGRRRGPRPSLPRPTWGSRPRT